MTRTQWQSVAGERLTDAQMLLEGKRWAAAYYLSGYVIECSLKACLLRHLGESNAIYGPDNYLAQLKECWTHDLKRLVKLAGLDEPFGLAQKANPALAGYWGVVKDWSETSRYDESRPEAVATAMYEAVSHQPDGVFQWIQTRW